MFLYTKLIFFDTFFFPEMYVLLIFIPTNLVNIKNVSKKNSNLHLKKTNGNETDLNYDKASTNRSRRIATTHL